VCLRVGEQPAGSQLGWCDAFQLAVVEEALDVRPAALPAHGQFRTVRSARELVGEVVVREHGDEGPALDLLDEAVAPCSPL
jgi:hypothetical protein